MEFDWYPDLYLMGSLSLDLIGVFKGGGYIVLEGKNYEDWFFEAFARAQVKVPDSIPIIGGVTVTQVDLGINAQKIWGQLKALGIKVGITYRWKGGLDIGAGELSSPTYPELLGFNEVPVYYDKESGMTLYMRAGTNLSVAAQAEITDDPDHTFILMGYPYVKSSGDMLSHRINAGSRTDSDAVVVITYSADSIEEARMIAGNIVIKDGSGNAYPVEFYEEGKDPDSVNANVTYDEETHKAAFSLTMTQDDCYDKEWRVETPKISEVVLYNVEPMPEIESVSGSVAGSVLNVTWEGTCLTDLDSVKFYLVSDKNNVDDGGYPIDEITDSTAINKKTASFAIPADVPEGDYYIRAIYVKDDVTNSMVNSDTTVHVRNDNTPAPVSAYRVYPAGDLRFGITIDNPAADAYMANVYEYDEESGSWVYSDISGYVAEKNSLVNNTFTVGGSYSYTESADDTQSSSAVKGLAAGKSYRIGLIACNYVDSDGDGEDDTMVLSQERFYSANGSVADINSAATVKLPEPDPPAVTVNSDKTPVKVSRTVGNNTENIDTFAASDITFTVTADKHITGSWTLDGDDSSGGTVAGTIASIPLTGLAEGDHTITINGNGPNGDGFRYDYAFSVDTLAPRLVISSPVNGSFFDKDGTLTVTGITDPDARFSVFSDGIAACADKTIEELNGTISSDGVFSFRVTLPDANSASKHEIIITASDVVGNTTSTKAEVIHGGLSDIQSVEIYADGEKWTNKNITTDTLTSKTYQLSLCAKTSSGMSFFITDEKLVSWDCSTVQGTATVDSDGILTVGADSIGFVTGSLHVAETGAITSGITFGAEHYSSRSSSYMVVTGSTIGGNVTGGGRYKPGDTVTLTAVPDTGYYFTGWTLEGVRADDASASVISFRMPENNVVATASFALKPAPAPTPDTETGSSAGEGQVYSLTAVEGQAVTYRIPDKFDARCFVPYYMRDGKKIYVPMSVSDDGMLIFIAPVTGRYYMEERDIAFTDISGHWAEDYIRSAAARDLFNGVGDGKFDPDGAMTRAMFVTVLWRLAGSPSGGECEFTDANPDAYYSEALAWASNNGIISGYGNGRFGVNDKVTREQMCVVFVNYLKYLGCDLPDAAESLNFADAGDISPWAEQAVGICRRLGIINGKNGNVFDPKANSTRAECCTVFLRLIGYCLENN